MKEIQINWFKFVGFWFLSAIFQLHFSFLSSIFMYLAFIMLSTEKGE